MNFTTRNAPIFSFLVTICFVVCFCSVSSAEQYNWGPYRGMSARNSLVKEDIVAFTNLGGNLLRIGFAKDPLMDKEPPFKFHQEAFGRLDNILKWCEQAGVHVVIDPHAIPGTSRNSTTLPNDKIWDSSMYQDSLVNLWRYIANRYKNKNNVVVGYDLLNEPSLKNLGFPGAADKYNLLIKRIVHAIREYDTQTPIIIEPLAGRSWHRENITRCEGIDYLDPPFDPRLVYSPHMYLPNEFTHQGSQGRPEGIEYPGRIGLTYWDKDQLRRVLGPVLEWQKKYNVPIYIGEFSASRLAGPSGDRYVQDLAELFEEYGWSWSYHSWREAPVWNAELMDFGNKSEKEHGDTPRVVILRKWFAQNKNQ